MNFSHPLAFPSYFYNFNPFWSYPLLQNNIMASKFNQYSSLIHPHPIQVQKRPQNLQSIPKNTQIGTPIRQPTPREPIVARKRGSKKKDENYGWRNQNKDRNLISVILKEYAETILDSPEVIIIVERGIRSRKLSTDVSGFRKFLLKKFPAKKTYVGLNYMKKVVREASEPEELVYLLRITLLHYLKEEFPLITLQNPQLSNRERMNHLAKAKSLQTALFSQ